VTINACEVILRHCIIAYSVGY